MPSDVDGFLRLRDNVVMDIDTKLEVILLKKILNVLGQLVVGFATFINFSLYSNSSNNLLYAGIEVVLVLISIMLLKTYHGKKETRDYTTGSYNVFTVPFGFSVVIFLGSLASLVVMIIGAK
jgi:hypothetical protein